MGRGGSFQTKSKALDCFGTTSVVSAVPWNSSRIQGASELEVSEGAEPFLGKLQQVWREGGNRDGNYRDVMNTPQLTAN